MNEWFWAFPVLALAVLAIVAFQTRRVFTHGEVWLSANKYDKAERPVLFGWIVFVQLVTGAAFLAGLVVWLLDLLGLRG